MRHALKRIHIVGRKNSGKTTLIVELVECLTAAGLHVGTIKHTHHHHELDIPGKDSHRHRMAGAKTVAILTPNLAAVFRSSDRSAGAARYAELEGSFVGCDLVVVEGDLEADAPKIEVWRSEMHERPYAAENRSIQAVITDASAAFDSERWPRRPASEVARRIRALLDI